MTRKQRRELAMNIAAGTFGAFPAFILAGIWFDWRWFLTGLVMLVIGILLAAAVAHARKLSPDE